MTTDRIAQIKAASERVYDAAECHAFIDREVPFLLAEVERLTTERDAATERESVRWVEALTSAEALDAAFVEFLGVSFTWPRGTEAAERVAADDKAVAYEREKRRAIRAALQAAAETIRGQE